MRRVEVSRILIVPVDVCIKRFYRAYAHVEENATDEEIRQEVIEAIVRNQGAELTEDPCLDIEDGDIQVIDIDHDGEWTEEEEEWTDA